jgi:hypothetical protein
MPKIEETILKRELMLKVNENNQIFRFLLPKLMRNKKDLVKASRKATELLKKIF